VLEKPIEGPLTLANFKSTNSDCFDRRSRPNLPVVDGHLHLRPFGGPPIPFHDLLAMVRRSGVLLVAGYGIGQRLPVDSPCTYYLDCPGVPVLPSLKNDFHNAQALLDHPPQDLKVVLSMTFPDLSNPQQVLDGMELLGIGEVGDVPLDGGGEPRQAGALQQRPQGGESRWDPPVEAVHG
jgi:hypothetical protein